VKALTPKTAPTTVFRLEEESSFVMGVAVGVTPMGVTGDGRGAAKIGAVAGAFGGFGTATTGLVNKVGANDGTGDDTILGVVVGLVTGIVAVGLETGSVIAVGALTGFRIGALVGRRVGVTTGAPTGVVMGDPVGRMTGAAVGTSGNVSEMFTDDKFGMTCCNRAKHSADSMVFLIHWSTAVVVSLREVPNVSTVVAPPEIATVFPVVQPE
jgi:hypothetical protein